MEETKPKQLYTTTKTQFGNQERINIQNDYPLSYSPSFGISPRAIGDNASGSVTVGSVTVKWNVSAGFLGLRWWKITYSDGTSEEIWGTFEDAKKHAQEQARKKAEEQSRTLPIGDVSLGIFLMFLMIYYIVKRKKLAKF